MRTAGPHPVIREALPHLGREQEREAARMAEELGPHVLGCHLSTMLRHAGKIGRHEYLIRLGIAALKRKTPRDVSWPLGRSELVGDGNIRSSVPERLRVTCESRRTSPSASRR